MGNAENNQPFVIAALLASKQRNSRYYMPPLDGAGRSSCTPSAQPHSIILLRCSTPTLMNHSLFDEDDYSGRPERHTACRNCGKAGHTHLKCPDAESSGEETRDRHADQTAHGLPQPDNKTMVRSVVAHCQITRSEWRYTNQDNLCQRASPQRYNGYRYYTAGITATQNNVDR